MTIVKAQLIETMPYICQGCSEHYRSWRLNQNSPQSYGRFTLCPCCAQETDRFIFALHNAHSDIESYKRLIVAVEAGVDDPNRPHEHTKDPVH